MRVLRGAGQQEREGGSCRNASIAGCPTRSCPACSCSRCPTDRLPLRTSGHAGDGGDPLHRAARSGDGPRVRRRVLYASGAGNSGHFHRPRWRRGAVRCAQTRGPPRARHERAYAGHSWSIPGATRTGSTAVTGDGRGYTEAQLKALERLLQALVVRYPSLQRIAGHDQLDLEQVPASDDPTLRVARKRDRARCSHWRGCWRRCRCSRLGSGRAAPRTCGSCRPLKPEAALSIGWQGGPGCGDAVNPRPAQPLAAVRSSAREAVLRKQSALTSGLGRGIHAADTPDPPPSTDFCRCWWVPTVGRHGVIDLEVPL